MDDDASVQMHHQIGGPAIDISSEVLSRVSVNGDMIMIYSETKRNELYLDQPAS